MQKIDRGVLSLLVVMLGLSALAVDRFVSQSGTWTMPGLSGECYTDLQTAVNEAQTGEIVWIQDGFVCDQGKQAAIGNGGFFPRIDIPNKVITVRSASGEVDEAAGKGATIRGEPDPDFAGTATVPKGCGTNGVRPLRVRNADIVVMGLILENGYTGDAHNYGAGGAIYGGCIVSNCLIRNNHCYCGGAVADKSARLYNCTITGNESFGGGYGGGAVFGLAHLYDCIVANNTSRMPGGAIYCNSEDVNGLAIYSNCVFSGSKVVGITYTKDKARAKFYDCKICNNDDLGASGLFEFYRCEFYGNKARAVSSSNVRNGFNEGIAPVLVDCVISNHTFVGATGGALAGCIVRDSLLADNHAKTGGAASDCVLDNCRLYDNDATDSGGAVADCTLTNCVIWNCQALYGGGVSGQSQLYGTVVSNCYAAGTGYGGGAIYGGASAYDCTFVTNGAVKAAGAIYYANSSAANVPVYSNCQFIANYDSQIAGAAYFVNAAGRPTFIDCQFRDNRSPDGGAGAVRGFVAMTNCVIAGNFTGGTVNSLGAISSGAAEGNIGRYSILEGCVVSNNVTVGSGGGASFCVLRSCKIVGNVCDGNGGGAIQCYLSDCEVVGNVSSNVISMSSTICGGGGLYKCSATNCVIAGNRAFSSWMNYAGNGAGGAFVNLYNCTVTNNRSGYRGAAVYNAQNAYVCYNSLFAGNYSAAPHIGYDRGMIIEGESANMLPGSEKTPQFYNCTITDNVAENYNIVNAAALHNCIVWGNSTPKSEMLQTTADHTCQKDLTPGGADGNICTNPKLTDDYRPRRPARNLGLLYPWMEDADDVRSKDLAGNPRVLGGAPDLGCYEPPTLGLILILR